MNPYIPPADHQLYPKWERVLRIGYAVAALIVLGGVYYFYVRPKLQKTPEEIAAERLGPPQRVAADAALVMDPAFSADGRLIAYAADRDGTLSVYVERVRGGKPTRVTAGPHHASEPDLSPDGRSIVFRSEQDGGGVYIAPFREGQPQPEAARLLARLGRRPRFSPDGRWVLYFDNELSVERSPLAGRVFLIPPDGGESRQLHPEFDSIQGPVWTTDSRLVLFAGSFKGNQDWWVASIDGETLIRTGAAEKLKALPIWSTADRFHAGRAYFTASSGADLHIWELPFAPETWAAGEPVRLSIGPDRRSQPAVAAGQLAYANLSSSVDIWSIPLAAADAKVLGEAKRVIAGDFMTRSPSVSADGKRMLYLSTRTGGSDLWVSGLDGDIGQQLTSFRQVGYRPVISPDGRMALYTTLVNQKCTVAVLDLTTGTFRARHEGCAGIWDWSPDGKSALFFQSRADQMSATGLLDLVTARRTEILSHPVKRIFSSRFSPDGRWIAFTAGASIGEAQLAIAPFHGTTPIRPSEWIAITPEHSTTPAWSPDGKLLYFRSRRDGLDCIWAQPLTPGKRPEGAAVPVIHFHQAAQGLFRLPAVDFQMNVLKDRLVLTQAKHAGSVWVAKIRK